MTSRESLTRAVMVLTLAGCALTSKSDPVVLRYFTPEQGMPSDAKGATPPALAPTPPLRLGSVKAATHLKERIAFRDSAFELGYYDELRWTERPEAYVRRALMRGLFENRAARPEIIGIVPTLDVELSAFEELRTPRRAAHVVIAWTLYDGQGVMLQRTLAVERPMDSEAPTADGRAVATAMAEALQEAVAAVATEVSVALQAAWNARAPSSTTSADPSARPVP